MGYSENAEEEKGIAKHNKEISVKIIKVKYCEYCPYVIFGHHLDKYGNSIMKFWCKKSNYKIINNREIIPKWCPLEDYKK